MAKGRVFLMEFIFISPRLMSLRHKDEAFLHIPFPIPYILRSNSSEPALLLRLSLLLVEREGTKKKENRGPQHLFYERLSIRYAFMASCQSVFISPM